MTFSKPFPKRIQTSNTSKPSKPNYVLENPIDGDIFISFMEIVPNWQFAEKGKIIIKANGIEVFSNEEETAFFSDLKTFPVAIDNDILESGNKIEVFVWNDTDSETLALSVNTALSEDRNFKPSFSEGISRLEKNRGRPLEGDLVSSSTTEVIPYTCPAGFKAKVISFSSILTAFGSASRVFINIRGQQMARWDTAGAPFRLQDELYFDFQDEELDEGQTISLDGNFASTWNASYKFAMTVEETRKA